MKKLLLVLIALLCLWGAVSAEEIPEYTEGVYTYRLVDGGAELTRIDFGNELPKAIVLPDTLGSLPLIGVGRNAFNTFEYGYWEQIQYIILPEGMAYLDDTAFGCCHNASVLLLPSTLKTIPEGAFYHFGGEIVLHQDNPFFTNHLGFLVDVASSTLLYASPSANYRDLPAVYRLGDFSLANWSAPDGDVIVPEGVEEIGDAVLYDDFYHSVTLPESLRSIGDDALPMLSDEPWYLND